MFKMIKIRFKPLVLKHATKTHLKKLLVSHQEKHVPANYTGARVPRCIHQKSETNKQKCLYGEKNWNNEIFKCHEMKTGCKREKIARKPKGDSRIKICTEGKKKGLSLDESTIFDCEGQTWKACQECEEERQRYSNYDKEERNKTEGKSHMRIIYLHNKSLQQEPKQRLILKVSGKILEDIHKMSPMILLNWKDVGKISTNFIQKASECSLYC